MNQKLTDKSGQGLSEYMILVMLIAVGSIAAARTVGGTIKHKLGDINKSLGKVKKGGVFSNQTEPQENDDDDQNSGG